MRMFHPTVGIHNYAESIGKIGLRIEIIRECKRVFSCVKRLYAIQCIDPYAVVSQTEGNDIPTLVEDFHAIGGYLEGVCCIMPETVVGQHQCSIVTHGVDDRHKKTLAGGDLFKQNPLLEIISLHESVGDSKGVQQPGPYTVLLQIFGMLDEVEIAGSTIAFDIDIKHFLDSLPMVVESF